MDCGLGEMGRKVGAGEGARYMCGGVGEEARYICGGAGEEARHIWDGAGEEARYMCGGAGETGLIVCTGLEGRVWLLWLCLGGGDGILNGVASSFSGDVLAGFLRVPGAVAVFILE